MNYFRHIAVASFASLLCASASAGLLFKDEWEKDNCTQKHSRAWCITKLGADVPERKWQIRDWDLSSEMITDIESNLAQAPKRAAGELATGAAIATVMGGTAASGVGAVVKSPAFATSVATDVIGGLLFNGSELNRNRLMVWLPADKPAQEAHSEFMKTYLDAWKQMLKADSVEYVPMTGVQGSRKGTHKIIAKGGLCGEGNVCKIESYDMGNLQEYQTGERSIKKISLPSWLGQGEAYSDWKYLLHLPSAEYYVVMPASCTEDELKYCPGARNEKVTPEMALRLSSGLPAYAYIYVGMIKGNKDSFPYLVNQGRPIIFAK